MRPMRVMDAIQVSGGRAELAKMLNVTHNAVKKWDGFGILEFHHQKIVCDKFRHILTRRGIHVI